MSWAWQSLASRTKGSTSNNTLRSIASCWTVRRRTRSASRHRTRTSRTQPHSRALDESRCALVPVEVRPLKVSLQGSSFVTRSEPEASEVFWPLFTEITQVVHGEDIQLPLRLSRGEMLLRDLMCTSAQDALSCLCVSHLILGGVFRGTFSWLGCLNQRLLQQLYAQVASELCRPAHARR